jgi:hypothetical protein
MGVEAIVTEEFKRTFPEGAIERVRVVPDMSSFRQLRGFQHVRSVTQAVSNQW